MTTESKKLQTSLAPNRFNPAKPLIIGMDDEVDHDARIAHEQREVIRKAVEAMGAILQPNGCDWQAIREALAAAAPFLED